MNAGLLYAFGAALLFSFKPVLVKLIYVYDLNTITILAWRMLLSLPVYLAIGVLIYVRKGNNRESVNPQLIAKALLVGLLGYYLASLFDLLGLQTITAQLERLILFTYPTWVAVFARIMLGQAMNRSVLYALIISYLGITIIMISDWQQLGGDVWIGASWILLSAFAFSLYLVLSKPIIDQLGASEFTILAMGSSSVVTLLHFFTMEAPQSLIIPLPAFWLILLMAIACTVLPTFMLAAAISRLGPSKTAITGTLGPAMTSIFAVILLDEYFGWPQAVGLVLVVVAIGVMQRNR